MDERARIIETILDINREFNRAMHREKPREWLDVFDITMPQLKTLLCLYGMRKASMGELADALGTGVSTVTGIFDRLIDHRLVTREEDPHDRRVVVGRLTPEGVALVDRLYLTARDRFGRVLDQLTLDELHEVSRGLDALNRAAARAFGVTDAAAKNPRCPLV